MTPEVRLREAVAEDREFLYEVYAASRDAEMAIVPWSAEEKSAFLRQQFEAQDRHYREHFPGCRYLVVMSGAERIGRLYLHQRPQALALVDIALLPAYRGQGIGERLIRGVMKEAADLGLPVELHVEFFNPAQHLYQRLGFQQIDVNGPYLKMAWPAR